MQLTQAGFLNDWFAVPFFNTVNWFKEEPKIQKFIPVVTTGFFSVVAGYTSWFFTKKAVEQKAAKEKEQKSNDLDSNKRLTEIVKSLHNKNGELETEIESLLQEINRSLVSAIENARSINASLRSNAADYQKELALLSRPKGQEGGQPRENAKNFKEQVDQEK